MSASSVIRTEGLTRDFKSTRAVNRLTLSVGQGELFGLIGPDGAGKSTTLRLLAGLLDLSDGTAQVLGADLETHSEDIKPNIGYMAQRFSLYAELSVLENLEFFAELFDIPLKEKHERMQRMLSFAGLTEFKERRAAHLSGGMQKKLALACTLIHQPRILLLDEPTTGVDPVSRREFWNILTELHVEGTTILISTPYMDEADRCTRVGLMYAGSLVECDTPRNIRGKLEGEMIELVAEDWQQALKVVENLAGVHETQTYGESIQLLVDSGKRRISEIERALRVSHIDVRSLRLAPARMEQAFISLIRRKEKT